MLSILLLQQGLQLPRPSTHASVLPLIPHPYPPSVPAAAEAAGFSGSPLGCAHPALQLPPAAAAPSPMSSTMQQLAAGAALLGHNGVFPWLHSHSAAAGLPGGIAQQSLLSSNSHVSYPGQTPGGAGSGVMGNQPTCYPGLYTFLQPQVHAAQHLPQSAVGMAGPDKPLTLAPPALAPSDYFGGRPQSLATVANGLAYTAGHSRAGPTPIVPFPAAQVRGLDAECHSKLTLIVHAPSPY